MKVKKDKFLAAACADLDLETATREHYGYKDRTSTTSDASYTIVAKAHVGGRMASSRRRSFLTSRPTSVQRGTASSKKDPLKAKLGREAKKSMKAKHSYVSTAGYDDVDQKDFRLRHEARTATSDPRKSEETEVSRENKVSEIRDLVENLPINAWEDYQKTLGKGKITWTDYEKALEEGEIKDPIEKWVVRNKDKYSRKSKIKGTLEEQANKRYEELYKISPEKLLDMALKEATKDTGLEDVGGAADARIVEARHGIADRLKRKAWEDEWKIWRGKNVKRHKPIEKAKESMLDLLNNKVPPIKLPSAIRATTAAPPEDYSKTLDESYNYIDESNINLKGLSILTWLARGGAGKNVQNYITAARKKEDDDYEAKKIALRAVFAGKKPQKKAFESIPLTAETVAGIQDDINHIPNLSNDQKRTLNRIIAPGVDRGGSFGEIQKRVSDFLKYDKTNLLDTIINSPSYQELGGSPERLGMEFTLGEGRTKQHDADYIRGEEISNAFRGQKTGNLRFLRGLSNIQQEATKRFGKTEADYDSGFDEESNPTISWENTEWGMPAKLEFEKESSPKDFLSERIMNTVEDPKIANRIYNQIRRNMFTPETRNQMEQIVSARERMGELVDRQKIQLMLGIDNDSTLRDLIEKNVNGGLGTVLNAMDVEFKRENAELLADPVPKLSAANENLTGQQHLRNFTRYMGLLRRMTPYDPVRTEMGISQGKEDKENTDYLTAYKNAVSEVSSRMWNLYNEKKLLNYQYQSAVSRNAPGWRLQMIEREMENNDNEYKKELNTAQSYVFKFFQDPNTSNILRNAYKSNVLGSFATPEIPLKGISPDSIVQNGQAAINDYTIGDNVFNRLFPQRAADAKQRQKATHYRQALKNYSPAGTDELPVFSNDDYEALTWEKKVLEKIISGKTKQDGYAPQEMAVINRYGPDFNIDKASMRLNKVSGDIEDMEMLKGIHSESTKQAFDELPELFAKRHLLNKYIVASDKFTEDDMNEARIYNLNLDPSKIPAINQLNEIKGKISNVEKIAPRSYGEKILPALTITINGRMTSLPEEDREAMLETIYPGYYMGEFKPPQTGGKQGYYTKRGSITRYHEGKAKTAIVDDAQKMWHDVLRNGNPNELTYHNVLETVGRVARSSAIKTLHQELLAAAKAELPKEIQGKRLLKPKNNGNGTYSFTYEDEYGDEVEVPYLGRNLGLASYVEKYGGVGQVDKPQDNKTTFDEIYELEKKKEELGGLDSASESKLRIAKLMYSVKNEDKLAIPLQGTDSMWNKETTPLNERLKYELHLLGRAVTGHGSAGEMHDAWSRAFSERKNRIPTNIKNTIQKNVKPLYYMWYNYRDDPLENMGYFPGLYSTAKRAVIGAHQGAKGSIQPAEIDMLKHVLSYNFTDATYEERKKLAMQLKEGGYSPEDIERLLFKYSTEESPKDVQGKSSEPGTILPSFYLEGTPAHPQVPYSMPKKGSAADYKRLDLLKRGDFNLASTSDVKATPKVKTPYSGSGWQQKGKPIVSTKLGDLGNTPTPARKPQDNIDTDRPDNTYTADVIDKYLVKNKKLELHTQGGDGSGETPIGIGATWHGLYNFMRRGAKRDMEAVAPMNKQRIAIAANMVSQTNAKNNKPPVVPIFSATPGGGIPGDILSKFLHQISKTNKFRNIVV